MAPRGASGDGWRRSRHRTPAAGSSSGRSTTTSPTSPSVSTTSGRARRRRALLQPAGRALTEDPPCRGADPLKRSASLALRCVPLLNAARDVRRERRRVDADRPEEGADVRPRREEAHRVVRPVELPEIGVSQLARPARLLLPRVGLDPPDHRRVEREPGRLRRAHERAPAAPDPQAHPVEAPVGERFRSVETILRVAGVPGHEVGVDDQPSRLRLLQHPAEREVGEPVVDIASADVRVHSGEPPLLERLVRASGASPDLRAEVVANLVDRERLAGVPDAARRLLADVEAAARARRVRAARAEARAERHHGVPDAEEDHVDRLEGVERRQRPALAAPLPVDPLPRRCHRLGAAPGDVVVEQSRQVVRVVLERKPAGPVEEAGHRLRGRGAAAEPEDEHLVAGLVVVREELERLLDVLLEPGAPTAPEHLVRNRQKAIRHAGIPGEGADADVVEDDLLPVSRGVVGDDGACDLEHVRRLEDRVAVAPPLQAVRAVPRPVETQDEAPRLAAGHSRDPKPRHPACPGPLADSCHLQLAYARGLSWLDPSELRVGLGCMRLPADEALALETVAAAVAAGVTLFDTARAYVDNERLVARALRQAGAADRARIVTKGGMARHGAAFVPDGRAKALRADCEASLAALDGLPVDLYLVHAPDPRTPWTTTVRALARLADEGLVRRVGVSNVNRSQLDAALELAPVAAVQVALSVFDDRALRGGVVERCSERGIAVIAHSPLGGPGRARRLARRPELAEVAAALEATPAEVAIAWLLDLSAFVVPIPGARRPETARSVASAATLQLDERGRAALGGRPAVRRAP